MLKHSLIAVSGLTLGALGVIATQSHSTTTQPEVSPVSEEGGIVSVYTVENNRKGQLIGRFVNKEPLTLSYRYEKDNPFKKIPGEPIGYEVDGYFVAKQAGEYAFRASFLIWPTSFFTDPNQWQGENPGSLECRYRLTIASETLLDTEVNSQNRGLKERGCGFATQSIGAIHLEAGKHRLRQWLTCSGHWDIKNPAMQFVSPAGCDDAGDPLYVPTHWMESVGLYVDVRRPQETAMDSIKSSEVVYDKP